MSRESQPVRQALISLLAFSSLTLTAWPQTITEYSIPTANSSPFGIAAGSDGALWFTETNKVGRITTSGVISEYPVPAPAIGGPPLYDITLGSDGALWFGEIVNIGRITTSGEITSVQTGPGPQAIDMTVGPDGAVWFINFVGGVGRITTSGQASTPYSVDSDSFLFGITSGPDGALWITVSGSPPDFTNIRRLNLNGIATTEYTVPGAPMSITTGPDGALWFTTFSYIGRITTGGVFSSYPLPSPTAAGEIIPGPDGALWFTEPQANRIGRISTSGLITEYPIPGNVSTSCTGSNPQRLTVGPDGALWFTEGCPNKIGRFSLPVTAGSSLVSSSTHIGSFLQGQSIAAYTLLIRNNGPAATSGAVSVTDTLPAGLTATAINGPGWACTFATLTCSRSDTLAAGASYPPITVTVSVAFNAASPVINQVSVSGGGAATFTASDPATIIAAFNDVSSSDSFLPAIDLLAEYSITNGCGASPPIYCPGDNITRGQMAVFVVRSVMGSDNFTFTPTPYFTDVSDSYPFFKWIQKLRDLGITSGCGATTYCPDDPVTRGQMAVFITLARYGASTLFSFPSTPLFTDVPASEPYFRWIQKMGQVGITSGCGPAIYCPDGLVTRGEMAVFIMRGAFNQLLPANTPLVVWISPANALPGQTLTVTIAGQNTNFSQGVTTIDAGAGVTVSNIIVTNGTTLTAQFAVASNAAPGPRSITVTTGSEEATLPNGFLRP